jgi:GNAT superfamily N-acetyltransferase
MPRTSTTSAERAGDLQAAGAELVRVAHDMVLELVGLDVPAGWDRPALAGGLRLGPVGSARDLLPAALAAYSPDHADAHRAAEPAEQVERALTDLVAGRRVGPLLTDASAVVLDAADAAVAAVIVTRLGPAAWGWEGGPWVSDVFVTAAWQGRGLGRTLLRRAIARCAADGEARAGLTVTDGNPAERLYRELGFTRRRTLYVLETA